MKNAKRAIALLLAVLLCLSAVTWAAEEGPEGTYTATVIVLGETELPASMAFEIFNITVNADGSAVITVDDETQNWPWRMENGNILFGDGYIRGKYSEGKIRIIEEEFDIILEKEQVKANAPISAASAPISAVRGSMPAVTSEKKARTAIFTVKLSDTLGELFGEEFAMMAPILEMAEIAIGVASPLMEMRVNFGGDTVLSRTFVLSEDNLYCYDGISGEAFGTFFPVNAAKPAAVSAKDLYKPDMSKLAGEILPLGMQLMLSGDVKFDSGHKTITLEDGEHETTEYTVFAEAKGLTAVFKGLAADMKEGTELNRIVSAYGSMAGITPDKAAQLLNVLASAVETENRTMKLQVYLEGGIPVLLALNFGEKRLEGTLTASEGGHTVLFTTSGGSRTEIFLSSGEDPFIRVTSQQNGEPVFALSFEKKQEIRASLNIYPAEFSAELTGSFAKNDTTFTLRTDNGGNESCLTFANVSGAFTAMYINPGLEMNAQLLGNYSEKALSANFTVSVEEEKASFAINANENLRHFALEMPEGLVTASADEQLADGMRKGVFRMVSDDAETTADFSWELGTEKTAMGLCPGKFTANMDISGTTLKLNGTVEEKDGETFCTLTVPDLMGMDLGDTALTIRIREGEVLSVPETEADIYPDPAGFFARLGESVSFAA